MSSLSWWRSWHGAPTDHKWPVIAARSGVKVGVVSAIAWALFDYASQHSDRGTVDGFDTEEYAVYSGFSEDEIKAVIKAMTDKGIITDGRLTNWEKRQPKREDDSTERVRKFREMKRDVTQGNAPDTDTDTESDTEKEKEQNTGGGVDYDLGSISTVYEKNFGVLTPMLVEAIKDDLGRYGLQACLDAMNESLKNNVRKWSYVHGILARRFAGGNGHSKKTAPKNEDEILAYIDIGGERQWYKGKQLVKTEPTPTEALT